MKVSFGKQLSNQDNSLNFNRIKSEVVPKNVNNLLENNINLIKNLGDDMSVNQLQMIQQICQGKLDEIKNKQTTKQVQQEVQKTEEIIEKTVVTPIIPEVQEMKPIVISKSFEPITQHQAPV